MTYTIKNAVWRNAENTIMDCIWEHPELGEIPYTASWGEPQGAEIIAAAGDVAEYVPEPEPAPIVVPVTEITRRQGLLALADRKPERITRKMIAAVIDAIEDEDVRERAEIEYEANDWHIGSPMIEMFAQHFAISDTELQELFNAAAKL